VQRADGALLQWDQNECNQYVLLGIENDCDDEMNIDPNTFQMGFWVPALSTITKDTVAVVKIKQVGTDIENKSLVIRGFNTPEYQGCKRSTYTSMQPADYAWSGTPTIGTLTTHEANCDATERQCACACINGGDFVTGGS